MLSDLLYRLRALFRRSDMERELEEELRSHLEHETEKYMARGMSADEARRQARLAFGGTEQVRQECREARGTRWLENAKQDIRFSLRSLRKNPGFSLVVVLTLALGIGSCTAIFSLVSVVLFPQLPYTEPDRLVYLYTPNAHLTDIPREAIPPVNADFVDLKRQSHSFTAMTQFVQQQYTLALQGTTASLGGVKVDGDFFATLGGRPQLGRTIDRSDDQPGHEKVVLLSHSLWRQLYAGRNDVLGGSLKLNGGDYRIIGVMPEGFSYPSVTDLDYGRKETAELWLPLALTDKEKSDRALETACCFTLARLRPGTSVSEAEGEMSAVMKRLDPLHDTSLIKRGWGAYVKPFRQTLEGAARPLMLLLLGSVGFVLLIACGNTANLLLARNASRVHELGVRTTLGAGRGRLIRQLTTESLCLGCGGGVLGILLAWVFLKLLLLLDPGNIPRLQTASLHGRVLVFSVTATVLTSVLTGLFPALTVSKINLVEFLKRGGSKGAVEMHTRSRSILIVAEVAMVVTLLAGAGLLLRSYQKIFQIDTGFSSSTISMQIDLPDRSGRYSKPEQRRAFYRQLQDRLSAIPGVLAFGFVDNLPFSGRDGVGSFRIEGYDGESPQALRAIDISSGYLSAMGISLLQGRAFAQEDTADDPRDVIVNESFARKYFAGRDPLEKWIAATPSENAPNRRVEKQRIIGVVKDVRSLSLEGEALPMIFGSFWQGDHSQVSLTFRSILPEKEVARTTAAVLKQIDPGLAFTNLHTMGELVSASEAKRRFQTVLLTVFSAMALALALVGFYGLLAYSVKRRTAEMGVRIALGASRSRVMRMVWGQGIRLAATGLLLGLGGAFALTRLLTSFLYGVKATDPLTFAMTPILLLLFATAACLIPGWSAANVDPVQSLRAE